MILPGVLLVCAGLAIGYLLIAHQRAWRRFRRANQALEHSGAVLCRWQPGAGWPIKFVSRTIAQFGYTVEDRAAESRGFEAWVHPADRERVRREVEDYTRRGVDSFQQEYRVITHDQQPRWVDSRTVIERDRRGQVKYYQSILLDISGARQAEEELRLAAQAFASTADGIIVTDPEHRIISVNAAFTAVTGYEPAEVLGKTPAFLRSGRHSDEFYAQMRQALNETGHWQGELWNRRKDGEIYPEWLRVSPVKDSAGALTHYVGVFTDISQRKQQEAFLSFLAYHDPLTGLANRALFQERAAEALLRAHRQGHQVALLFIDLDRFKTINDSLGHAVGDLVLQAAAERLRENLRESDFVARLGGDEFSVLLEQLNNPQDATKPATKLLESLAQPVRVDGRELFVSASVGISCYPGDGGDVQTLLRNADAALYRAKEEGRNNIQFFSPEMNARALETLNLSNSLRQALERNEFLLQYQPCLDLLSGKVTSVETLIRWQHPEMGLILPARFIPLAEETGAILPIGEWVLKNACVQAKYWREAGLPPLRVAVNLSARQFKQTDLAQRVAAILRETGLPPSLLELEITESMVMQDPHKTQKILYELKALGVTVAIDDFGTGYSSLSYLKRFPIDYLKIDQSFVSHLPGDNDNVAITRAIVAMAKSLKLRVIAEGVETAEQHSFLETEGCEEAQGFLFGKPQTATELERLLRHSQDKLIR